jgi:hypothetical protein
MLQLKALRDTLSQMTPPLLSLYLHVDNARRENQSDNPAWRIELKNEMGRIKQELIRIERQDEWKQVRQQIDSFLHDYETTSKSLVLFADRDQLHTYHLSISLASQAHYGEPLLMPLLWAMDEYERYLVVQVDKEQARFISAYLGSASAEDTMHLEIDDYDFGEKMLMPARNAPDGQNNAHGGNAREQYDSMIEAHVHRFYKDIAEHIRELSNTLEAQRIILSGDEQAAHTLMGVIPQSQRENIIGIVPVPMNQTETEVLDRVLETALDYERQQEQELVEEVLNLARADGRGALGADE